MKLLRFVLVSLLVTLFVSCMSIETHQYVPFAKAADFLDVETCRIYVMRPEIVGAAAPTEIIDAEDFRLIGETKGKGYLCWDRPAGEVVVIGQFSQNLSRNDKVIFGKSGPKARVLPFTTRGGQTYYIQQIIRLGGRTDLKLLNASDGKRVLLKCKGPPVMGQSPQP